MNGAAVACTDANMSVAGQITSSYISRKRTHELGAPLDARSAPCSVWVS